MLQNFFHPNANLLFALFRPLVIAGGISLFIWASFFFVLLSTSFVSALSLLFAEIVLAAFAMLFFGMLLEWFEHYSA